MLLTGLFSAFLCVVWATCRLPPQLRVYFQQLDGRGRPSWVVRCRVGRFCFRTSRLFSSFPAGNQHARCSMPDAGQSSSLEFGRAWRRDMAERGVPEALDVEHFAQVRRKRVRRVCGPSAGREDGVRM